MLLNVSRVRKEYGADIILSDVSFRLERKEKVALVGRNGTGKTTLLKLLAGDEQPDGGSIQFAKGIRIGYLRQQDAVDKDGTVLSEAQNARQHALKLSDRLNELETRLENNPSQEELEEYAALHEHFVDAEGYAAERDIRTVLQKMGFAEEDFEKPASVLSGGERTRLALARQILEEPDLLILDEPTNHLDLQAAEWLENWLRGYPGAVLVVSHDRAFLESFGDRFLELANGTVTAYPGPFERYRKVKAENLVRQVEVAKRQQDQIDKLDEFVRRFMNSERTAQARGRLKRMEKLKASQVMAPSTERGISGAINCTKRTGDVVFEVKKLEKSFSSPHPGSLRSQALFQEEREQGPHPGSLRSQALSQRETELFSGFNWTVSAGERWGIIGENGTGKSTLVRILLGLEPAGSGTVRQGTNLEIGYFSQDAENLDPNESPLEFLIWECDLSAQQARNLLGRFLIEGDDVFRPIKTFSGGEKNKISLARLTAMNPNVLILDEPTNHLDMDSREALAGILREYAGTLLLISHDRWLLGETTNRILDLRRSGPTIYPGGYGDYRRGVRPSNSQESSRSASPDGPKEVPAMTPRELSKEIVRLQKLVEEIEFDVAQAERDITQIEEHLAHLPADADVIAMTRRHAHLKERLDGLVSSWAEQSARLEELEESRG